MEQFDEGYVNICGSYGVSPLDPTKISEVRFLGETEVMGIVQAERALEYSYKYQAKCGVFDCKVFVPVRRGETFEEEIARALKERQKPEWRGPLV